MPRSEIPDRLTECEEIVLPVFFTDIAPIGLKFSGWRVKGCRETMTGSDRFGRCTRERWYARSDGEDWDLDYLGVLCDFVGFSLFSFRSLLCPFWKPVLQAGLKDCELFQSYEVWQLNQ